MRAVDFDPDAWLADAKRERSAIPASVAIPEAGTNSEKIAVLARIADTALPQEIVDGLVKLRMMPPPRITKTEVWPEIVADAVRIVEEGWATQAIDLDWHPLHLFGVEPSADPDTWDYSLAVIMEGWPIRTVGAEFITLRKGNACRPFKNRARPALTKYLWELGN